MDTATLSDTDIKNLLKENDELKDQLSVMEFRHKSLKEQNQLLQSGMRMAGIDQLPSEVVAMARARMSAGLTEQQAIECALNQYRNDVNAQRVASGEKPVDVADAEALARKTAAEQQAQREQQALEQGRAARKK